MSTLAALTALPTTQPEESLYNYVSPSNNFQLSSLLPTMQGQGPIASAMRIAVKLLHQPWLPRSITGFIGKELPASRRKDDELHGKAVKVIDLLQHAADLGHTEALYTLGQISVVSGALYLE